MHTKRFNTLFKRWLQFRVGAISRLPLRGQKKRIGFIIDKQPRYK